MAWQEADGYHGQPIYQTGNGRIDLLRPELRGLYAERTAELKKRYGDFILINTNFGAINHFFGNLSVSVSEGDKEPVTRAHDNGYILHRQNLFHAFVKLMPELAKAFPKLKIVLRPHPGESPEAWRDIVKGSPNVEINMEGSVVPWILASKALVHNGCTTGLEAYVLGQPAVAYQPLTSAEFELRLPNDLSLPANNERELFSILAKALDNRITGHDLHTKERTAILAQYVSAADGDLATERLSGLLEQFLSGTAPQSPNLVTWPAGAAVVLGRAFLKRLHRDRAGHKSNIAYTRHRFPHTEIPEVTARVLEFSACLKRFQDVTVRQLDENIFEVQKAGTN